MLSDLLHDAIRLDFVPINFVEANNHFEGSHSKSLDNLLFEYSRDASLSAIKENAPNKFSLFLKQSRVASFQTTCK